MKVKINKDGQITLPRSIREKYGFAPGITLDIRENDKTITLEPAVYCHRCGKVLPDEFEETRACPDCPPIKRFRVY